MGSLLSFMFTLHDRAFTRVPWLHTYDSIQIFRKLEQGSSCLGSLLSLWIRVVTQILAYVRLLGPYSKTSCLCRHRHECINGDCYLVRVNLRRFQKLLAATVYWVCQGFGCSFQLANKLARLGPHCVAYNTLCKNEGWCKVARGMEQHSYKKNLWETETIVP